MERGGMIMMERSGTPANILVIDDDQDDLKVLQSILTEQGYTVRISNSGKLALESARILPPDLILLDILMPEMDGYEVCAALKADDRLQEIPVMFLSALEKVEKKLKGFELGGFDYIGKPIQPQILLARVNTHLLLRQTQKRLEDQNAKLQSELAEHQQTERTLQESEKRLRALIENSEDIIFMQDLEGRYLYYNGPARYEITSKDLLGKTPFDLFPHETASAMMEKVKQAVAAGKPLLSENSVTWQNDVFWFSDQSSPVCDEQGNIVAVSTISRNITERKLLEDHLRIALHEKELLLQEMHHRVKNNMQMMTSLCRLHAEKISDEEALGIFRDLENKIASVARVHEMLYQSENLTRIDMRAYLEDLIYRLFCSFEISDRQIIPRVDVGPVYFGLSTAMPCGLLINELVTNSFKYAFPNDRNGELDVSLHRRDDDGSPPFELIISDNGVGLPDNLDPRQSESLGFTLVMGWINQLQAELRIERDQGTCFRIRFRELYYEKNHTDSYC